MDQPPQDQASLGTIATWIALAIMGALLSVLRWATTVKVAIWNVFLAAFLGPLIPYLVFSIYPTLERGAGYFISGIVGLSICCISIVLENTYQSAQKANLTKLLPKNMQPPDGDMKP